MKGSSSRISADRPIAIRSLHRGLRLDRRRIAGALRILDNHRPRLGTRLSALENEHELSVVFLSDAALARLHADFLADPSGTDVITFAGDPALGSAGEICISASAAARFASARDLNFSDEVTRYLVHGWLHLAGHDDLRPTPKRAMRRAEARALRFLRAAGAMPRFTLRGRK